MKEVTAVKYVNIKKKLLQNDIKKILFTFYFRKLELDFFIVQFFTFSSLPKKS